MSHASWLKEIVNPNDIVVCAEELAKRINDDMEKFNFMAIAVSGYSGSVIGGIVSYLTKLPIILVRKDGENKHSSHDVEYSNIFDDMENDEKIPYCIIDDLISSGKTIRHINTSIKRKLSEAFLEKIYLYHDGRNNEDFRLNHDRNEEDDSKNIYIPVNSFYGIEDLKG